MRSFIFVQPGSIRCQLVPDIRDAFADPQATARILCWVTFAMDLPYRHIEKIVTGVRNQQLVSEPIELQFETT